MNKILLGIAIITGSTASFLPEVGISKEEAIFTLVFILAIIKMFEMLEGGK